MDEAERNARETYYRDKYILKRPTSPSYVEAQTYFNDTIKRLSVAERIKPYVPDSPAKQSAYMAKNYGDERPIGVGMRLGETITMVAARVDDSTRFIATDSLQDCQALVLVARGANGKVLATQLSHFDRITVVEKAVPKLLADMPKGSRIEATVLNGDLGYHYYMQADLLNALAKSPRVRSIRYNFDDVTTVGVDTTTGKILTNHAPEKKPGEAYKITHLPLNIALKPQVNDSGMNLRTIAVHYFDRERAWPQFGLDKIFSQGQGFREVDEVAQLIDTRQNNDGVLDAKELAEIAKAIAARLHTPVTLAYQPARHGQTKIDVITAKGTKLDPFFSTKLDPALGERGSIDPANTPLVQGRASATNTTSPPFGKAPTGRQ